MGLLLDLAVGLIAMVVTVSLAVLAWTFGISGVAAVRRGRAHVAAERTRVATMEADLLAAATDARASLEQLADRTRPIA